jgi:hypothetical protein
MRTNSRRVNLLYVYNVHAKRLTNLQGISVKELLVMAGSAVYFSSRGLSDSPLSPPSLSKSVTKTLSVRFITGSPCIGPHWSHCCTDCCPTIPDANTLERITQPHARVSA